MKNLVFTILIFVTVSSANAQFLNWGVKAGLNYNANGDLVVLSENIASDPFSSDQELGYHLGLLAEIKLPLFMYLRPELLYVHTESSYPVEGDEAMLKMNRIDVPVLLGFRVFKIGRFFLGPNFQYILNTDLSVSDNITKIKNISYDDFNVAAQVGFGLNFGRLGADIRWEAGLMGTEALYEVDGIAIEEIENVKVDTDNMQFLLSVYWKFGKGKK
jgi:hypothetical protein